MYLKSGKEVDSGDEPAAMIMNFIDLYQNEDKGG